MRPLARLALAFAALVSCLLPCAALAQPGRVGTVAIEGRTLEAKDRLQRFLGLAPGTPYQDAEALRSRVDEALKLLGYVKLDEEWNEADGVLRVRLSLQSARVVRHVTVKGNWPILDEDIRRRLTLRPGSRLPLSPELLPLLDRESDRIKDYLRRNGYFDGDVDVVVVPSRRPEWVDLEVLVHLGRWFKLVEVEGHGNTALSNRDLLGGFSHWYQWGWFGRLQLDRLRDDARDVEKDYRDKGYPAARVLPEFDPARDLDRRTGRARLRVNVLEKARVEIRFTGNHSLTERQLLEKVTIFSAGSYDDVELAESAKELHRLYQAHGHLEAQVTWGRKRTADSEIITFAIDEGPELKVRRIEFVGESGAPPLTADEDALRKLIATRVFPRIGEIGLGGGGYVTNVQLAQDVDKIAAYERSRGYPEVRVRGVLARDAESLGSPGVLAANVAAGRGNGPDLFVRFYIDEGRNERVGRVAFHFVGVHVAKSDDVFAVLAMAPGTPFALDALRAAIKRIPDWYAARGHPYVQVRPPVLVWRNEHSVVDLQIAVDEGPEVRFGDILVRGNFKTAEWVVRRNLPFAAGDLFDVTKIALGERNLQTHGIFNGVRIIPLGLSQMVNPVPILVDVQQERYDNWGELVASVGYSTDVGLSLLPGYFWGNVFGGGGQLELRLELAIDPFQAPSWDYSAPYYRRLSASLRYIHPHIIWPSLRAEVAGFVRKEDTVRLGEIDSAGVSASLSWVYSPRFRLFVRYDWTLANLASIEFFRLPGRGDVTSAIPDQTRTGKLTLGIVFDDRVSFEGAKNPLMPVSGSLAAVSVAVASTALGGNHDFLVVSGQAQRYQPLGAGVTLIGNVRGDWGFPLSGDTALPAVDRFFAGGDVATRGFQTDKLRTEIVRYDVSPVGMSPDQGGAGYRVIPQGGNVRFLATIELQFPVTTLGGFPWVGALFFDAGTVFDRPQLFDFASDVKYSVGVTLLRLLTPVGPISLEYAYPITQTLAEQDWKTAPWYRHWPGLIHFNWGIPILR